MMIPDNDWERNLYRHPNHQNRPNRRYRIHYDMYSLEVCLLEIGLCTSFLCYAQSSKVPTPNPSLDMEAALVKKRHGSKARGVK